MSVISGGTALKPWRRGGRSAGSAGSAGISITFFTFHFDPPLFPSRYQTQTDADRSAVLMTNEFTDAPGEGMEGRHLHGAACHGCALISETSCEMRNDYLDRSLVVPTLAVAGAAFFPAIQ